MDEHQNIDAAARNQDWQECARNMFWLLYTYTRSRQRDIAKAVLYTYVVIWKEKHEDVLRHFPEHLLEAKGEVPEIPEFPEDLDPADAEFENGLIEFYNGSFFPSNHARHTMYFATAIRSAVTARQINRWLQDHPDDYAKWKSGRGVEGSTFQDDEAATLEAQSAWRFVDDVLKRQPPITHGPSRSSRQIATSYQRWEDTFL
jgi:hypothetical protein